MDAGRDGVRSDSCGFLLAVDALLDQVAMLDELADQRADLLQRRLLNGMVRRSSTRSWGYKKRRRRAIPWNYTHSALITAKQYFTQQV
jgi:hypothetical protein